jgi:tetratricopeptide (TPR) repeat protein
VCVIARDEEQFIGDCLASVRPFVDEMIVLDTGSADRTVEIARTYGARVETFEWQDDFSAARNAAMDLATSEWVLMLDADERLQAASGPALQAFVTSRPTNHPFYAPAIENRTGEGPDDYHVSFPNRLFKPGPDLRYVGTIHEDLVYRSDPAQSLGTRVRSIRITHLGYLPEVVQARNKIARNRRLLLKAVEARPEDPLPRFYLGMDHAVAKQPAEAAEYFLQSLARSGNRPNWTSTVDVYAQLIWAYAQLKDSDRMWAIVEEAERAGALTVGARCELAQDLVARGLYAEAARQLVLALEPGHRTGQLSAPGIGGWLTRLDLSRIYERMDNPQSALRQVELAFADPELVDKGEAAASALRLSVQIGDLSNLARYLEVATPPGEDDLAGHLQRLELRALTAPTPTTLRLVSPIDRSIALRDWQAAYDAALSLHGRRTPDAARLLFIAGRLQRAGAPEAALDLLERLLDDQPALPQLHQALIQVLADLHRFEDALAATEILQTLLASEAAAA